jgi:catechol 2,3-dioxygenase-like lactoylglutathione lyase family enzyme
MPAREFRCCFYAADYEGTLAFYRDGLGLGVLGSWDRAPDDRGTLFAAASGVIEVLALPRQRPLAGVSDTRPPQGVGLVIEVDDVAAWYRRAVEQGLPISEELVDQKWGHRSFQLTDPAGVGLYVFSKLG